MLFSVTGVSKHLQCAIEVYTIDIEDVPGPTVVADLFIRMLQITGFVDEYSLFIARKSKN